MLRANPTRLSSQNGKEKDVSKKISIYIAPLRPKTQRRLKDRELNQARSKPDTVNRPVGTARIFVHHYTLCYNPLKHSVLVRSTVTQRQFLFIFPFLQTNITSQYALTRCHDDTSVSFIFDRSARFTDCCTWRSSHYRHSSHTSITGVVPRDRLDLEEDNNFYVYVTTKHGHVLRKDAGDWIRRCLAYEVEVARPRSKKTWKKSSWQRLKMIAFACICCTRPKNME